MKWITREDVRVDRVACPWLISKFVDKNPEFIFVPADKVMAEAKRLDAIPYDVRDVELGYHGKECSFEAILKKYKLTEDHALNAAEWICYDALYEYCREMVKRGKPAGQFEH